MSNDELNPTIGSVKFDGSEFILYLANLPDGELQGKRTAQEGCSEVCKEILSNQPSYGGKAGVTEEDFMQVSTTVARIARIDVFIEPIKRFVERLIETRYVLDDQLQKLIFNIATSVDRRGKDMPELLASYKLTRAYRSMAAKKAVKTRLKKEAEAKAEAAAAAAAAAAPAPVVAPAPAAASSPEPAAPPTAAPADLSPPA